MPTTGSDPILRHLSLHSGHTTESRRSEVDRDIIDALLPLADAGGGPVPAMGDMHLFVVRPPDAAGVPQPGAAFFQFAAEPGLSSKPFVQCMGCWSAAGSRSSWDHAGVLYRQLRRALEPVRLWRPMPADPPPTPWLAVWLLPHIIRVPPGVLLALGDLERCLLWALVEGEGN